MKWTKIIPLPFIFFFCSCASFRPYTCGPVLRQEQIQIFKRVNEFLDLKPGDVYADVGSSSGYYVGAMAVFLDSVDFYLQDIDEHCLNDKNVKGMVKHYSRLRGSPIDRTNRFFTVIGTAKKTNLPSNAFDKIYSNATYHVLAYPDEIMTDISSKLKQSGYLFIRDEFVHNGEEKLCDSKKCRRPVPEYQEFITVMERNGFELIGKSDDFGSYPIYKFKKT